MSFNEKIKFDAAHFVTGTFSQYTYADKLPDVVTCFYYLFIYYYYFYKLINYFIYLFLAALGLRCCARAFSSCGERGLLFVAVCGLLIEVASLVAEHGL